MVLVWTQWPGIGCHFFSSIVSGPWGGRREWNGAPMPTDTIPRVGYTSGGAPVPPNTAGTRGLDAMVGNRPPFSPSIVPGSSVGIRERNAPMATDTVSVVRHRSVASPEASNTAHGPVLDAMVGNRAPFFSSIESGPPMGRRDWNEAPMITDTFSRVEYSVGASVPPKTVQGPGFDTMAGKRPPLSLRRVQEGGIAQHYHRGQYPPLVSTLEVQGYRVYGSLQIV